MSSTPPARKRPGRWEDSSPSAAKHQRVSGIVPVVKDLAAACRKLVGRPVFVRVTHTMADVCDGLISADQSAAVVLETHEAIWRPILALTENDILRTFLKGRDCRHQAVGDWMRSEGLKPSRVHSVPSSTSIAEAAERLTKYSASSESDACQHLLVTREECDGEPVDESQFVGILSSLDLARAIAVHMVDEVCSPHHTFSNAPADLPAFDLNLNAPATPPVITQDVNPSGALDSQTCIDLDSHENNEAPPLDAKVNTKPWVCLMDVEKPEAVSVEEVMKPFKEMQKCVPKTTMREAAEALLDSQQGVLVVHDGPQMRGIVTPRDFLRAFSEHTNGDRVEVGAWVRGLAQDISLRCLVKTKSIFDAARQMADLRVHHLLVTDHDDDDKKVVGVLSSLDLALAIALVRSSSVPKRNASA